MTGRKPNIVFILADDMGYGDLSCNNPGSKIPTPHLDALAGQSIRFSDAHAASSVCSPSRYALLTGRYCWRTALKASVLWPWDPPLIAPGQMTVPALLRQQGYRTACIGKWHLGWDWATRDGQPAHQGFAVGQFDRQGRAALEANIDYSKPVRGGPIDCGFDYHFGVDVPNFPPYAWIEQDRVLGELTEEKPADLFGHAGRMVKGWTLEGMIPELARRSVRYIADSGPEPFFLYLALTGPHTPIVPNREFLGRSRAGLYGDFVCEMDWVVGQVVQALADKGIADDTLLIFSSDNGPECIGAAAGGSYEHIRQFGHYSMAHLRGVKRDTWEGGHRVPLLARWPGVAPAGSVCGQLTCLGDLLATCADLLGAQLPAGAGPDSLSMLPLLQGRLDQPVRDHLIHHSCSGRFAIRQGDWVFIDAPSGDDNHEPDWFKKERGYVAHEFPGELFRLSDDIAERRNLYGQYPEMVQQLGQRLAAAKHEGSAAATAAGRDQTRPTLQSE